MHDARVLIHLAARTLPGSPPLIDHAVAAPLWARLRRVFPSALAAALMPNHVHVITPATAAEEARGALARLLGSSCRAGALAEGIRWDTVGQPSLLTDREKVQRNVRYVVLNPVRDRLVSEPLSYRWTTHRDVMGAIHDPWVDAEKLRRAISTHHTSLEAFRVWWHAYVSTDGHVTAASARVLLPAAQRAETPYAPLSWIAEAVAATLRAPPEDLYRRTASRELFLHLAAAVGWTSTTTLARACRITPCAVRRALQHPDPPNLQAVLLCLGDPRLRS